MLVLISSIGLWAVTQYGIRQCTVVVDKHRTDKYRTVADLRSNESKVQLVFRFVEPPELAGPLHDYALAQVPADFLPDGMKPGRRIQFCYREQLLSIGFGKRMFWEVKAEDPFNKSWLSFF